MSMLSRWEAPIEIPTGDWTFVLAESGGGGTPTVTLVAARKYYWTNEYSGGGDPGGFGLRESLEDAINTASPNARTYTVTLDATSDTATGKLTIAVSSGDYTMSSVDADLLSLMGFAAGPVAASTATGTKAVEALWLPDCVGNAPDGLTTAGRVVSQSRAMIAPGGTYSNFKGASRTENQIWYDVNTRARTVAAEESVTNESYETFWLDAVRGDEPWSNAGEKLQVWPDRNTEATSHIYNMRNTASPDYERAEENHDNYYRVTLELVKAV